MKLDQLRKIIREEVKAAVKEELQEVMNEAVRIASKPQIEEAATTKKVPLRNTIPTSNDPIMEMLNQTRASMTSEEYKNVYTGTSDMVQKPNFASTVASNMGMTENRGPMPGLDISQFDWAKKAGAVYKKSVEKDKEKYGRV